jgi:type IV secretory pathway protease TraF
LFFRVEGYLDEHAMAARYNNPNAIYSIKYFLLNRKIAAAYDTRYFRKVGGNEIEYETWFDQIQRENLT